MTKCSYQAVLASALAVGMALSAGSALAKDEPESRKISGMRLVAEKIADDCKKRDSAAGGMGAASQKRCEKILEMLNAKFGKAENHFSGSGTGATRN